MRFTVGKLDGQQGVFAVKGGRAVNLSVVVPEIGDDLSVLAARLDLMAAAGESAGTGSEHALSDIEPALPIAAPGTIICLGLNYVEHIREGGYDIPDYPALFMRGRSSRMAAGAPMVRSACSDQLDYEAELMLIIGRGGRHIPEDRALEHVFGYTAFNDGSVRNYQRKTHQWTPGKNFDSTGAIGPCVVRRTSCPKARRGSGSRAVWAKKCCRAPTPPT